MKKAVTIIMIVTLVLSTIPIYSNSEQENTLRGFVISYENNILTLNPQDESKGDKVINDTEGLIEKNYPNIKARDFIEVAVELINIGDTGVTILEGYIKSISYDETNSMIITLTSNQDSDDVIFDTIVYTSNAYTYYQKELEEGMYVRIVASSAMTKSIPPQTSGYLVY